MDYSFLRIRQMISIYPLAVFYLNVFYLTFIYFLRLTSSTQQIQANAKTDTIPVLVIFISGGITEQKSEMFCSAWKKSEAKASWLETVTKMQKIRKKALSLLLKLLAFRLWDLTRNGGTRRREYKGEGTAVTVTLELCHHQTFKVVFLTLCLLQDNLPIRWSFCLTERTLKHGFFSKGQGSHSPIRKLKWRLECA